MVEYRHMTVNGAVNYAYDDRYVATFSFAADGSDNYRPGNRWGFYPSLGLGWIVSRERFLRDSRMVDLLKLRASVGKNGWDPMGEMRYLWEGYYTGRGGLNTGNSEHTWHGGTALSYLPNPGIFAEKSLKYDAGIDLREHIAQIELNLIRDALDRAGGVVAHAAQLLGLRRTTLVEKLRKSGVEREDVALATEN